MQGGGGGGRRGGGGREETDRGIGKGGESETGWPRLERESELVFTRPYRRCCICSANYCNFRLVSLLV